MERIWAEHQGMPRRGPRKDRLVLGRRGLNYLGPACFMLCGMVLHSEGREGSTKWNKTMEIKQRKEKEISRGIGFFAVLVSCAMMYEWRVCSSTVGVSESLTTGCVLDHRIRRRGRKVA